MEKITNLSNKTTTTMEKQLPKTGKFGWTYGLISGVIGIVFGVMLYTQDMHYQQNTAVTVIQVVIGIAVIVWAILAFKKANEGYLTISQALKIGAGVALIGALIAVLYTVVLSNFIDPDFAAKVMDDRMANSPQAADLTAEQIRQQKEMGIKYFWMGYPVIVVVNVLFGLVIGLITGLIAKKARPDY